MGKYVDIKKKKGSLSSFQTNIRILLWKRFQLETLLFEHDIIALVLQTERCSLKICMLKP